MDTNVLYYGDNLEILRKYIPDSSIDLVYLDPPFNSKATYNVLYKEQTGEPSQAQITAFEDTWHWGLESEKALQEIFASPIASSAVKDFMSVMPNFLGKKTDMAAYLVMMCIRLLELKRSLKDTGSIYLHCNPTASHYLKILMDAIFEPQNFLNEIVWCFSERERILKTWNKKHDIILLYAKEQGKHKTFFQRVLDPYSEVTKGKFKYKDEKGWYQIRGKNIMGSPVRRADGLRPEHELQYPGLTYRQYLKEGVPPKDWWVIPIINKASSERLGYPTQKPLNLLERIVNASSDEGDIVLDPFCGCGTTLVAAQKLNRKWIGIDITHLAIGAMKWRLEKKFPNIQYKVIGEPKDLESAKELANQNKYQFQWWAVSLVGGQPYGDKKKGADTGIDGYLYFMDEKDKVRKAIIQVKAGAASVSQIRDLVGVIQREKAEMGLFLCLESATKPMQMEADSQGFYHSPLGKDYPKIQIFTIEQLVVEGRKPDIPPWIAPVDTPPTAKKAEGKTIKML